MAKFWCQEQINIQSQSWIVKMVLNQDICISIATDQIVRGIKIQIFCNFDMFLHSTTIRILFAKLGSPLILVIQVASATIDNLPLMKKHAINITS